MDAPRTKPAQASRGPELHGPGDVPDRQLARDGPAVVGRRVHRRAAEGDVGQAIDGQEVSRAQVGVPLLVPRVDARRFDDHLDPRPLRLLGDGDHAREPLEAAPTFENIMCRVISSIEEWEESIIQCPGAGSSRPPMVLAGRVRVARSAPAPCTP